MPDFPADQVRTMLLRACYDKGSQRELAKQIGVHESFLSHIIRGTREPSGKVLRFLGLRRVVRYESNHPLLRNAK